MLLIKSICSAKFQNKYEFNSHMSLIHLCREYFISSLSFQPCNMSCKLTRTCNPNRVRSTVGVIHQQNWLLSPVTIKACYTCSLGPRHNYQEVRYVHMSTAISCRNMPIRLHVSNPLFFIVLISIIGCFIGITVCKMAHSVNIYPTNNDELGNLDDAIE